jgi:hypothetical protein
MQSRIRPRSPSGVIANDTTAFVLGAAPASFIFSSEQGVIAGWNGAAGKSAAIMADRSSAGAVYKGLATATRSEGPLLYAADFGNGKVDVFDGQMNLLSLPGAFTDSTLPASRLLTLRIWAVPSMLPTRSGTPSIMTMWQVLETALSMSTISTAFFCNG